MTVDAGSFEGRVGNVEHGQRVENLAVLCTRDRNKIECLATVNASYIWPYLVTLLVGMTAVTYLLFLLGTIKFTGSEWNEPRKLASERAGTDGGVPVFYINLDRSEQRRIFMEDQFLHLFRSCPNFKRIRAQNHFDVRLVPVEVRVLIPPTSHELGCICSHLLAIWHAVHDEVVDPENPFALILEDDIALQFDVDFRSIAKSAPDNFGILQLTTSNSVEVDRMWREFVSTSGSNATLSSKLWREHSLSDGLWSTQAYLIQKAVVRRFINSVVKLNKRNVPAVTIKYPNRTKYCSSRSDHSCFLPFRMVADLYLYAAMTPVYTIRVPIFNGASVGVNTTIPTTGAKQDGARSNVAVVSGVIEDVKLNVSVLPYFIRPFQVPPNKDPLDGGQLVESRRSRSRFHGALNYLEN
jgi:GR25 family glycosyltransferase involved in LPS biosynthesis